MALHFYFDQAMTNKVSEGDQSNPDVATGSGTSGFSEEKALYVGNDSAAKRYESVQVTADGDDALVDIKYAPDNAGAPGTFVDVLDLGAIAASGVAKFWRKVTVASGQSSQNRVNIKHKVTAVEWAV